MLGQGNLWRLGQKAGLFFTPTAIRAFAQSDAGTLTASVEGKLGLIKGHLFQPALREPEPDMQMAGGPADTLILYSAHLPARIYGFDGKNIATLATLNQPITALTHLGDNVIFATRDGIYSLRAGEPPGLLFPLAGHAPMTALDANPKTAELFAATNQAVYQLDEGRLTEIAQGIGGALAVIGTSILVADIQRKTVYVISAAHADK